MADRDKIPSLTSTRPQKKFKAKQRHALVAVHFQKWLKKNPKATHKRKFDTFDAFCDSVYLQQTMETFNSAFDKMNEKLTNA